MEKKLLFAYFLNSRHPRNVIKSIIFRTRFLPVRMCWCSKAEEKEDKSTPTRTERDESIVDEAEKHSVEGGVHHYTKTTDPIVRSEIHTQGLGQWSEKLQRSWADVEVLMFRYISLIFYHETRKCAEYQKRRYNASQHEIPSKNGEIFIISHLFSSLSEQKP
jgi:hypothetical protein